MLFVAAPLYVSAARASFAQVDAAHELTARTLGAGPWRAFSRVSVPLAARGLLAGAVVTWARAVSEFGAVVVLAYHPRTMATLAYERYTGYGLGEALPVAAAMTIAALGPLVLLRALRERPRA
jgi:molybdate/tungstate transport system permease protein